jgi:hypothetical protein
LRTSDSVDPGLEGVSATPTPASDIASNDTYQVACVPPGNRSGKLLGEDITTLAKSWLVVEAVIRILEYLVKPGDINAVGPGNMPQGGGFPSLHDDDGGVIVLHHVDAGLPAQDEVPERHGGHPQGPKCEV